MQVQKNQVLIVPVYPWHNVILGSLRDYLLTEYSVTLLSLEVLTAGDRPASVPELVIVADAGSVMALRAVFPDSLFLHVGHGLISKNETQFHYGAPDYICVASEAAAVRLTARGHVPRRRFIATGLIQSDPLFRGQEAGLQVPGCPVSVLYAPTWNPALSSALMLGSRLVDLIRGNDTDIGVVIKPHPHTPAATPDWMVLWQDLADRLPHVMLLPPEDDVVPALSGADVLITDASSTAFYFLALNRPIIQIDNPRRFVESRSYDPAGIEWLWRDIGDRVEKVETLPQVVQQALADPTRHQPQRLARRAELFGSLTDGRALERVMAAVGGILRGEV